MNMWGGDGKLEIPRLFRNAVKRKRGTVCTGVIIGSMFILICGEMRSCLVRVHFLFLLMWRCFHNMELQCVVQF